MTIDSKKFKDPYRTAKGEERATVPFNQLETLWFNTGSKCNLSCRHCYMESSPTNNRLLFLELKDITPYLDEISIHNMQTKEIGLTGGEPFMNPNIISICNEILNRRFELLILTNGHHLIESHKEELVKLHKRYKKHLKLRISLDHYSKEIHEKERGSNTFDRTLKNIKWLSDHNFNISIAGRSLTHESIEQVHKCYRELLESHNINSSAISNNNLVIFPEMSDTEDVPEITIKCWNILNKKPEDQMCATARMVIKRAHSTQPVVVPCTLLVYDTQFDLGNDLQKSQKKIPLNHRYCAQFCVLGGASCS
jgi:sulfatase maturation enzyme AslB (radical SAM superfamily)